MRFAGRRRAIVFAASLLALGLPLAAYIGPGAGFAFLSSFLVLFLTFFLALFSFLSWPFRLLWRLVRGQKAYKNSQVEQVVIVGLDGMAPELAEKFMAEGKLPQLAKLKAEGYLRPPADDDAGHLAGGLVFVHDRGQSVEAQHLRFPQPRSAHLSPRPVFRPHRPAQTDDQDRPL